MEIGQGQSSVISEDSSTRDVISDLLISPFGTQWLFYNYTMIENYTFLRNESQFVKFIYFRQVVVSAKCLFGEKSARHTVRSTKCPFD